LDQPPAADSRPLLARSSMPSTVSASPGAPSAPAASAARPDFSAAGRNYTVHLASFQEIGNAEKYLDRLTSAGETAFISESTVRGALWHRVMSGRFSSKSEAEAHGRDLKRRGLTAGAGSFMIKALD
jgi:cell division septation protein DedD